MFFSKDSRAVNIVQVGGTASTMGLHIVSAIVVGLTAGYYLDDYFGTKPWLLMIFFLLGVVAGFKMVFEDFRKLQRRAEEQQHRSLKQDGEKSAGDDQSEA
ncbi:MAG: AtpZ/AtpI family protein [Pseudodesulfovibrio sp.]